MLQRIPLLLAEYRQAFATLFLFLDGGYGGGYKEKIQIKKLVAQDLIFLQDLLKILVIKIINLVT